MNLMFKVTLQVMMELYFESVQFGCRENIIKDRWWEGNRRSWLSCDPMDEKMNREELYRRKGLCKSPQKSKNRTTIKLSNPTSGYLSRRIEVRSSEILALPSSMQHSSRLLRCVNHQMSTQRGVDKENQIDTYNRAVFSFKKQRNSAACDNMDEAWGHHAKWN